MIYNKKMRKIGNENLSVILRTFRERWLLLKISFTEKPTADSEIFIIKSIKKVSLTKIYELN